MDIVTAGSGFLYASWDIVLTKNNYIGGLGFDCSLFGTDAAVFRVRLPIREQISRVLETCIFPFCRSHYPVNDSVTRSV